MKKLALHFASVLALAALASAASAQVTLPLEQFEKLRARASAPHDAKIDPPAPFAFERAELQIEVGEQSARVIQDLSLVVYGSGWQQVPLGELGSFSAADFFGLEGRVEATAGGWALQVRGVGRRSVRLESVLKLQVDETSTRKERRAALRLPPAALVRGSLRPAPGLQAGEIEEALLVPGLVWPQGAPGTGIFQFVAGRGAGAEATLTLFGRRTLPERAQLPLRFDAVTLGAAKLTRTRLVLNNKLRLEVAQGQLKSLSARLPEGFEVLKVGGPHAGFKVDPATREIVITPLEPIENVWELDLSLAAKPTNRFKSPLVIPLEARRTLALIESQAEGDGLLSLVEVGSARISSPAEAGRISGGGRRLYTVKDSRQVPTFEVEWASGTQVLAAQIDRLLVDVALGRSGTAAYQVWLELRNRGALSLGLQMPAGFELASATRDGQTVAPGQENSGGTLTLPLFSGDTTQTFHLSGFVPLNLPATGDLSVVLPQLSAPAAKVELRLILPGLSTYQLADPTRAGRVSPPPGQVGVLGKLGALQDNEIANALFRSYTANAGPAAASSLFFARPPGQEELHAVWNALSATPGPLFVKVRRVQEESSWF